MNCEKHNELSLEDRIAAAHVAFRCALSPGEKRMRWRALAELMRRREENREDVNQGTTRRS